MRGGGNSEPLNSRVLRNRKICNISGLTSEFFAFTLAEVLITLGIIGIVAAITMPSIVSNIQGMQYRSKVKKTYSTLVQAGSLAKANYDVDYTTLEDDCTDPANDKLPASRSACAIFNTFLSGAKYISETDPAHPKNYFSTIYKTAYHLADGSTVALGSVCLSRYINWSEGQCTPGISGMIDVNGKTGPNKFTSATDPQNVIGTESYVVDDFLRSFPATAYYGKPDQFYDVYYFNIPMKNYEWSGNGGALRYVMTH